MHNPSISIAWTGASGAPYGVKLVKELLSQGIHVYLMISSAARVVLKAEHNLSISASPDKATSQLIQYFGLESAKLEVLGKDDWFSPVASGSAAPKQMVVCPCSMGSLAAIATGMSNNLIERAADVVLKERGKLLLLVREMPFHSIHLEHMLKLSNMGAVIMPASPGFYHKPQSIDDLINFVVARILDHLEIKQDLMKPWGYKPR